MQPAPPVAVVTGASSGIGKGIARALAESGYRLGLIARRTELLDQLARELVSQHGITAATATSDVGNRDELLAAFRALKEQLGPVDLLVANAGLGGPDQLDPFASRVFEDMFRVNVLGVVYSIEAVLPDMLVRGSGHLAAVSSMGAFKGMPGSAAYCASKAAVSTLMESLRIELCGRGIRVTTICPGFVKSEMTAVNTFRMPGLLDADDAGRRIVRAIRRNKKVFKFPWQMRLLMPLVRIAPDWLLARFMPRKPGA